MTCKFCHGEGVVRRDWGGLGGSYAVEPCGWCDEDAAEFRARYKGRRFKRSP